MPALQERALRSESAQSYTSHSGTYHLPYPLPPLEGHFHLHAICTACLPAAVLPICSWPFLAFFFGVAVGPNSAPFPFSQT